MAAYRCILLGHPFPLMGKGKDRGARKPIEPITPTFVLPRRGEGIRPAGLLRKSANSASPKPIFEDFEVDCESGPNQRAGVKFDAAAHYPVPSSLE